LPICSQSCWSFAPAAGAGSAQKMRQTHRI
jgi:hypothetical protein